ncbi:MAG: glycerophosphodiester phosphodiesterase [Pseudomonadota bacterium]|nr:glycerophosphodiester phosphodiesterase [Pseudomonadota bacterium]
MKLRPLLTLFLAFALGAPAFALDLQAHRGGRGLRPENTLAAFENAIRIGVTTLELDIAITADGVAVISHEPALYPGTARDADGRWLKEPGPLIHSLTLAELQRYDVGRLNPDLGYGKPLAGQEPADGQRIPTLASLFALIERLDANDVQFDIETKVFPNRPDDTVAPDVFVKTLLAVIRDAGMTERVMIQSFDWRTLELVQRLAPGMRTVYLTTQGKNGGNVADPAWTRGLLLRDHPSVAHMVKAAGGTIWASNFTSIDASAVPRAHGLGLQLIPWTVNEPVDMRRLIDWGVDGIITDYPDRLRAVMQERGLALPPSRAR